MEPEEVVIGSSEPDETANGSASLPSLRPAAWYVAVNCVAVAVILLFDLPPWGIRVSLLGLLPLLLYDTWRRVQEWRSAETDERRGGP